MDENDLCRGGHGALSHAVGRIRSRTRGQRSARRSVGRRRAGSRRSGRRRGDRVHRGACDRPIVGVATVRTERPGATVEPLCVIECGRSCAARRAAKRGRRARRRPRSHGDSTGGSDVAIVDQIGERLAAFAERAGIRVSTRPSSPPSARRALSRNPIKLIYPLVPARAGIQLSCVFLDRPLARRASGTSGNRFSPIGKRFSTSSPFR